MSRPRPFCGRGRAGLTLVELLVALGLASLVLAALIQLLALSLDLWSRGETRRSVVERTSATLEMVAEDLRALEGGARGDLVCDWARFDLDGDGLADRVWPRLRFVRQAGAPLMQRLHLRDLDEEALRTLDAEGLRPEVPADPADPSGLVEVAWVVLPASADAPHEGVLFRGERRVDDESRASLLDERYFGSGNQPAPGSVDEIGAGVLWFGLEFASQTSVVKHGWSVGPDLADAAASWDAWGRERPDPEASARNLPAAGMPEPDRAPLLPRRVRVTLELESAREARERTRLAATFDAQATRLRVERGDRLPSEPGAMIWVAGEWMEVLEVSRDFVRVRRGARQTTAQPLPEGARVHFGTRVVTEVPIPLYKDDWNL